MKNKEKENQTKGKKLRLTEKWMKNDKIEEKRKIAKLDKIEFDKMLKMNEIE